MYNSIVVLFIIIIMNMITIEINLINLTQTESWLNNIRILQIRIFKLENKNGITWDPFVMWITKDIINNININVIKTLLIYSYVFDLANQKQFF